MNLKSYNQYLNEDLSGEYNYYGPGSLFPIVQKLKQEGKSPKVIYVYLTSLGIDEVRKQKVIAQAFMNESFDFETMQNDLSGVLESSLFEDGEKPTPEEIDDLLNADPKDLAKGIDPKKAKPDVDFKKSLDKLKDKDAETSTEEPSETPEDKEEPKSDAKSNIDALQSVIRDAEKLEKIREILKESRESQTEE